MNTLNQFEPPTPLSTFGQYGVYKLRIPKIAENMTLVWNYAVVNEVYNTAEVFTDSFPGAQSIMLKLQNGVETLQEELQKRLAEKEKTRIQAEVRERKSRLN